ncbi:unnamed protein product [Ambrosiozyma monospora]|uniref:Unnamed protein product n=1 Tax=Ambrosiozyma monospora TaxID=43982 RepID=A0ACB5U631_AMBMO|nr:unnamed protein product [Ambrosiozyma monospora]
MNKYNINNDPPAFKIKTSKKWVLPPRPKPGRKPSQVTGSKEKAQKEQAAKKRAAKKQQQQQQAQAQQQAQQLQKHQHPMPLLPITKSISSKVVATAPTVKSLVASATVTSSIAKAAASASASQDKLRDHELEESILKNPIKQEILKINEENYYLKLQVIKLVSDLKSLKNEITMQKTNCKSIASSDVTAIAPSIAPKSTSASPSPAPVSASTHAAKAPVIKEERVDHINAVSPTLSHHEPSALSVPPIPAPIQPKKLSPISPKPTITATRNNNNKHNQNNNNNNNNNSTQNHRKPTSPMDMLTDNGKIPMNPIPMSRKRSHDEDINDLIVSLLDLSHTTPSANALAITTSTSPKTTTSPTTSTKTNPKTF